MSVYNISLPFDFSHHHIIIHAIHGHECIVSYSTPSSVVVIILHLLDNGQVFLKVGVLEVFVLLLVISCLIQVSLSDVLHDMDALFERLDRFLEVLSEAQILVVLLDLCEAFDLELCTLQIEPQITDLLLHLLNFEVDFGGFAESERPVEERSGP